MRASAWIWIVSMASMFTFLSVFWWALQRRKEREAYYRYELARQLIERAQGAEQQQAYLEWLRQQEAADERKRREGLKVGAFVLIATGIGFLTAVAKGGDQSIMGWVPLFVGVAIFAYLAFQGRVR